ncbi:MAG: type 4a pilus biogenesis protein PilO [Pseudomonadota bacterium]
MKFDASKLKELNELDFEQVHVWPYEIKLIVAVLFAIIMAAAGYYLIIKSKLPQWDTIQVQEEQLKRDYESKYRVAINLQANKDKLEQINESFASALRSLPTRNETPGLLDDITFVGTDAGLSFKLINWEQENPKEFYTELPIKMEVSGQYHEFGSFASNIANLPRIVTLHDFVLERIESDLVLTLQARTYRSERSQSGEENEG